MAFCRGIGLAVLVCLLSAQYALGARKVAKSTAAKGGKAQCHVAERAFSSSNGFQSYGVSYNLVANSCAGCNLFLLKDLSPILKGELEGDRVCRCWGKAANKDAWNEFFSFKKLTKETCDWGTCWELYGNLLSKKRRTHVTSSQASDDFHSQNHWEATCTETDAAADNFQGPSLGEVIGVIVTTPKKPDNDGDKEDPKEDPIADVEPLIVEQQMKDDIGILSDDMDDDDLEEEELIEDDIDDTPVEDDEPKPVVPAMCHKTTPPDACQCIQKHDKNAWKKGQFSEVTAAIATCICNLENGEEGKGLVTAAGRSNCMMKRTMTAMKELGGFACKLQKYNGHGANQRCHPAFHGKDITGAEARATFD